MIDPAYDGEVFSVAISDIPAKETELVAGAYDLEAPAGKTIVAAKLRNKQMRVRIFCRQQVAGVLQYANQLSAL